MVGVLGGVASGKSLVTQQLAALGAGVLDADGAGHAVLKMPEVIQLVRARWGDAVLDKTGHIDRRQVAKIVFAPPPAGPPELAQLERWTHPRIGRLLSQQAHDLISRGHKALVLDAAVMEKAGWDRLCSQLWFVDAPREIRLARARKRGWSQEEFSAREGAQQALEEKRRRASVIIDNSGPPAATAARVARHWHALVQ